MNDSFNSLYAKAVKAGLLRKNDNGITRVVGTVPASLSNVVNVHNSNTITNSFKPYYGT